MSYLERLQAKAAQRADSEPAKGSEPPFTPFAGDPDVRFGDVARPFADYLRQLTSMPTPRDVSNEVWLAAVRDAQRISDEGWAAQAVSLGWNDLELFGAVTDPEGDPMADGLAVKLAGRKVLAICASFATVADVGGGRSYLYRGNSDGARLLWTLGRGR